MIDAPASNMMKRIAGVKGAGQSGNHLAVTKLRGTVDIGSIVVIEGVMAVDRVTKDRLRNRRQFVVIAAAKPGDTILSIYPSIATIGRYRTVSQAPRNRSGVLLVEPCVTLPTGFCINYGALRINQDTPAIPPTF